MVGEPTKVKDLDDGLATKISNNKLFDFNAADIFRMRSKMFDMLGYITSVYRDCRIPTQPMLGRLADVAENSDDSDDDVMSITSTQGRTDAEAGVDSGDSASDWEYGDESSVEDEDEDDVLVADSAGKRAPMMMMQCLLIFFFLIGK